MSEHLLPEDLQTLAKLKAEHNNLLEERSAIGIRFEAEVAEYREKHQKKYEEYQKYAKESSLRPSEQAFVGEYMRKEAEFETERKKAIKRQDKKIAAKDTEIQEFIKHAKNSHTRRVSSIDRHSQNSLDLSSGRRSKPKSEDICKCLR